MKFDWENYAELARNLKSQSDEAALRSAISRIYYSALNQARVHLQQRGIVVNVSGASSHDKIWREYFNRKGKTPKAVWKHGKELHEYRIQADYHDEITDLNALVGQSFVTAEKVFTYLTQVKAAPHFD